MNKSLQKLIESAHFADRQNRAREQKRDDERPRLYQELDLPKRKPDGGK